MKILLANKFFFINGGAERVFFQEREFLKNQGIRVVDFSMRDPRNFPSAQEEYFVPNVRYRVPMGVRQTVKMGFSLIYSPGAVRLLQTLVEKERPDIAHLHNIYHQITPSIIPLLKRNGVKVVLTMHDGKLICPSYLMLNKGLICEKCQGKQFYRAVTSGCHNPRGRGLLLALESYFHKLRGSYLGVDIFISPSQFLADIVGRYRISQERIRVLRNGVDTCTYIPSYIDKGYGLYFGRVSKEKGVATLLMAHEKIPQCIPLKIVGSGPVESELKARYPKPEFLGFKSGGELTRLIDQASFVVVPSEWYENCSMVVLESMALGKPVIASRTGGIPEQVEHGKTGFLFEMGNWEELAGRIQAIWGDPDLRQRMGRAARVKLQTEFSLERHCKELLVIYREAMAR